MTDIVGKLFSAVLFIVAITFIPLMLILNKNEAINQSMMETAVVKFVDNVRSTGKISEAAYREMYAEVSRYVEFADIKMIHESKNIGYMDGGVKEYFVTFNNDEILNAMYANGEYKLRMGDTITLKVKNTKRTMAARLTPGNTQETTLFYTYTGTVGNYAEEH